MYFKPYCFEIKNLKKYGIIYTSISKEDSTSLNDTIDLSAFLVKTADLLPINLIFASAKATIARFAFSLILLSLSNPFLKTRTTGASLKCGNLLSYFVFLSFPA